MNTQLAFLSKSIITLVLEMTSCILECWLKSAKSVKADAQQKKKKKSLPEENTLASKWAVNLALRSGSVGIWACKCTERRLVHSLQSCQMLLCCTTSVTRDPCNSRSVLGPPAPQISLHWSQMTDTPFVSVPPNYPSSLWPPQHLCLCEHCPRIPAEGPETWARGELIARATEQRVRRYQKTEKTWERRGWGSCWEQDRSGTGSVCLPACFVSLRGLSYKRKSEEQRGGHKLLVSLNAPCLWFALFSFLLSLFLLSRPTVQLFFFFYRKFTALHLSFQVKLSWLPSFSCLGAGLGCERNAVRSSSLFSQRLFSPLTLSWPPSD